jgi:hypothetical protein
MRQTRGKMSQTLRVFAKHPEVKFEGAETLRVYEIKNASHMSFSDQIVEGAGDCDEH